MHAFMCATADEKNRVLEVGCDLPTGLDGLQHHLLNLPYALSHQVNVNNS